MECFLSLKIYFFIHTESFSKTLGAIKEEQGERFHQDIQAIEKSYPVVWKEGMIGDFRWMLYFDNLNPAYKRKLYAK